MLIPARRMATSMGRVERRAAAARRLDKGVDDDVGHASKYDDSSLIVWIEAN
jgi:hypothetical protein